MKKSTTNRKKLVLTRQTVAALDKRALAEVAGGMASSWICTMEWQHSCFPCW